MKSPFLLEIMNGASVVPELLWLMLLGIYLSTESKRRGLHALDWFRLPPSMNLILAVFICDLGVNVRSTIVWAWRVRTDGIGDFTGFESGVLIFGAALIVFGSLCKIRAMTYPDQGSRPWLIATAWTALATAILIVLQ